MAMKKSKSVKKVKKTAKKAVRKTKAPATAKKLKKSRSLKSNNAKRAVAMKERLPYAKMLSTGSGPLDRLLGGGLEEGSSILILGTPHCGKKPVLMNIASAQCKRSKPVVFILTDIGAVSWISMAKQGGWDCGKNNDKVFFVDCYAQQFGACAKSDNISCMEVPFSMSAVSIEASNFVEKAAAISKQKPVVFLHSLSTLIELFGDEETYRFVQFLVGKFRTAGITTILSLQMGVHSPRIESAFTTLVDGVLELKEGKIRASGYRRVTNKEWVSFEIVNGKLKLNEETTD